MRCPDCHNQVYCFDEFCRKCGAELKRSKNIIKKYITFWD